MAARFWVNTGSANTWAATVPTNWAATSGSTTKVAVPGATDDVTFDGAGAGNSTSVVSANITILSLTFTAGYTSTVTINTAVTLTVAGNFTDNTAHSWVVNGTGSMTISATSTITSNGKTFPGAVTFTNTNTKTLSGDWTIGGVLLFTGNTTLNWTTNEVLHCTGGITCSTPQTSGTAKISIEGGTWTGGVTSGGALQNDVDIAGNVVFATTVGWCGAGKTFRYVSGTPTVTSSTFLIQPVNSVLPATFILDTNGMSFNNVNINTNTSTANALTVSLSSNLSVSNILYFNSISGGGGGAAGFPITFAGSGVWTTSKLYIALSFGNTTQRTVTLVNSQTYTIQNEFKCIGATSTFLQPAVLISSDHATNKAILTLNNGAICSVMADFTRIDASNGRAIWTFIGTVTTCNNIFAITDLTFVTAQVRVIQGNSNY